jgi:hypothetical protein
VTDRVFLGADEVVGKIQDAKWQAARAIIEAYGRECYNLGAQRLLERLDAEMDKACPACGDKDCAARRDEVVTVVLDGSPGRCT